MSSIAPATNPRETGSAKLDSVVAAGKKCKENGIGVENPPLHMGTLGCVAQQGWGWRVPSGLGMEDAR